MTMLKPQYYIHMRIDDIWYCLWKMKYQKHQKCMKPIWFEENQLGEQTPYLYSSLAVARNVIDHHDLANKEVEVAVWSNDASI